MTRLLFIFVLSVLTACDGGSENSDGSSKSTYSSCRISSSEALLASDRERDLDQCWDGVEYEEQNLAMDWCDTKVSAYMDANYAFGHSIEYEVASTNCVE